MVYFGGDEKVYFQTLREYRKTHGNDLERIKSALKEGDIKTACRMAHTLKSSSAFIGAETLSGIALTAEDALKAADQGSLAPGAGWSISAEIDKILAELENAFLEILAELDSLPGIEEPKTPFDRDRALDLIEKLVPLLEVSDAAVFILRDEIEEIFVPFGDEGKEFLSMIDGFEFPEAAKILFKIKGML